MQRPTSVTVFGVLNIVFALWGGIGMVFLAVVLYSGRFEQADLRPDSSVDEALSHFGFIWGLPATAVLLAAGIGLLRMRPWGRQLSVVYSILTIVVGIATTIVNLVFVVQPMLSEIGAAGPGDDPEVMAARFGAIGGVVGGCVGFIYPVLLWYFMTRPHVVAAFGGAPPVAHDAGWVPTGPAPPPRDPDNPYGAPQADSRLNGGYSSAESVVQTLVPTKNSAALWAYYLGLFSLFPCLGFFLAIPAVYFGIQGLRLVRQHPEVRGGTHAWVGVICGLLFGAFNFLLLVGAVFGMVVAAMEGR